MEVDMAGPLARMGEMRKAYTILVANPEGKNHWKTSCRR
jgi:hypothetical protein